nr:retrotransposon protein, putative, Ty1-copia subclass [Tanacetum cinerariifolium]
MDKSFTLGYTEEVDNVKILQSCNGLLLYGGSGIHVFDYVAATAQNPNNTTIRSILLAEKLTGLNFTNWYRNLRIVLRYEKKMKFVKQPIGLASDPETADPDTIDKKPQGAKGKDKGKNKIDYAPKPKIPPSHKRYNSTKDSICHHCKEAGHWRRNCPSYQAELKKRKEASMASTLDTTADQRTMAELLRAPTVDYAEAIMVPSILAEQFELKTTNLRNEISNFQQRFDESFHEAWDRYKDLLRACLHHGFTELHQFDTFYNALNPTGQDYLNSAAGGNLLERRTQDVLTIIENKSKCLAADGNTFPELRGNIQGYVAAAAVNYNQGNSGYRPPGVVPPSPVQKPKPPSQRNFVVHQRDPLHPNIPYPSRMYKQKQQEKDEVQIHKFWQMFTQLHINITLTDALILIPKYQKMLKALLSNKEKLLELANIPFNENCSAVILKKLPEKLRDLRKFLIPCGFSVLKCKALADLGSSINLMPLSVWKKLESISMINIYDDSSEDFLGNLFSTNHQSGNLIFSSHPKLTSPKVKDDVFDHEGGNVLPEKLLDLDSTKDLYPPHNVNPLSGSTTSSNHLLEELADELVLITFPSEYDDGLTFDIESDLKEIEYLLHHDPIKDMDSSLKDLIDQSNLDDLNDNLADIMPEMFTDEHALDYSSPPLYDECDDDLLKLSSTLNIDFLPSSVYDSFLSEDFSKVDALPSTNNKDKVFNPGILIRKNLFEVITRVAPEKNDKKLAISHASLIPEDFDPPTYELSFFKEVPRSLSFSSENEEKLFKPGILTSKEVHSSLIQELSHQGYKVFKINQILKSPMKIFLFSHGEDIHILDVPYMSHEFVSHMKIYGIVSQLTPPYTPQQNKVFKRRNQTLLDMVRSMMNLTTLPKSFWGYALESAARILNMVSTKKVERTPYEIWHGKAPKFPKGNNGLLLLLSTREQDIVDQNAEFFDNNLIVQEASESHRPLIISRSDKGLELIQEKDTQPSENTSEEHNVLVPIELPPNGRTVRSKWLFKKKTDMDGNVHTFNAHPIAKGYTQTYSVDYGETFSSVADLGAISILLAIAAFYDYEIWQTDIKTTFLNGYLSEDVYMVQPKGFMDPKHQNKVCKLQHFIYRLKQASRSWNKRFDEEIKKIGFTQNLDEPCVYLKASESSVAFLVLYVDDILLMGNNVNMLQEVKSWLCSIMYAVRCRGEDRAKTRPDRTYPDQTEDREDQILRTKTGPMTTRVSSVLP